MVPSISRARPSLAGMSFRSRSGPAGDPSGERGGRDRDRRRADPGGRPAAAAERHRHPGDDAPSAGTLSLVSAKTTPRVSFFTASATQPALRNRQHPAPERPPHRRDRRTRRSRPHLLPQRRRTAHDRRDPLGRGDGDQAAGAQRPLQLPGRLPGSPARRPPRYDLDRTAQPQLRLLRLRLPDPRQARLRRRRRPLRRRALRPYPPGPGRDGRLRPALVAARGGSSSTRAGTTSPATTWSSTARARPTTPPTCTSPNRRR